MDFEDFKNVQILALHAVEKPDFDAFYRRVCRHLSNKFSTPLKEVEEMSEPYVLQHYFEDIWGDMYAEKSNEEIGKRYETVREAVLFHDQEAVEDKDVEDEEWVKEMIKEVEQGTKTAMEHVMNETEKLMQDDLWGADKFIEGEDKPTWDET